MHALRLAVLPSLLLASTAPTLAQTSQLNLVAFATSGLANGDRLYMGGLGHGTVTQRDTGVFDVTFTDGRVATFTFTSTDPCVFLMTPTMENESSPPVRYNLDVATGITYYAQDQYEGLNATLVTIEGPPEVMQTYVNDTWHNAIVPTVSLVGSANFIEMEAAAEVLMGACLALEKASP